MKPPCRSLLRPKNRFATVITAKLITCVLSAFLVFSLAGCGVRSTIAPQTTGSNQVVIGGQEAVTNSTIQLYAVATSGDGMTAAPLLTKQITTAKDGSFSISGLYSCPSATDVYITAIGGNPLPNVTNPNLALMAALGPCTSINSQTPIVINELTTIAAVNSLAPFMTSYVAIGSGAGDVADLNNAFTLANELVNPATGISPGVNVPVGYSIPTDEINTLGDVIVPCVNSAGGVAGDGTPCGDLFKLTTSPGLTPPTNTIAALLYLAKNPYLNTDSLFQMNLPNAPFQPELTSPPPNFAISPTPNVVSGSLQISSTSINFPITEVGSTSQAQVLTLTTNATTPLPMSGVTISGNAFTDFAETNLCPSALTQNESCTIQVTYTPLAIGTSNAVLQVNGGAINVGLTGSSESAATAPGDGTLQLSASSLRFPATAIGATSQSQNVTVSNNTAAAYPISSVTISGVNSVDFTINNECPPLLPSGGSCIIQTGFSPQNTTAAMATLQINGGILSASLYGQSSSPNWSDVVLAANPAVYLSFNDSTTNFVDQISGLAFIGSPTGVTSRQPGFDTTQPNNTSAAFAWDGWTAAPQNTIGNIEWNEPWTMLIHIDKLNWDRRGTLVLASKGDISTPASNWWALTLGMEAGGESQLCFTRNSVGTQNGICTDYIDAMPNGLNYDIVVEDNGTGSVGVGGSGTSSALSMYINGLQVVFGGALPGGPFTNSYSDGFGHVRLAVSGGTGYADVTPFTSSGGGPNCHVAGFMYASGGIPYNGNWTPSGSPNYGCTSVPTIVLSSPTGTGAVITATLQGTSMNSATLPIMVPGYVSNGTYYGVGGTDNAQNITYVDEFAIFPGNLDLQQIETLFSKTKFHQGLVRPSATQTPVIIFDNDAGGDMDNFFSLQMSIALHQQGFITLAGTVIEDGSVTCEATWRQMLDQAGLENLPLSVPSVFAVNTGTGFCTTADVDAYDPSTPQSNAAWGSSTTMYRSIFAQYSTTPINIVLGGPFTALAEFMQSPADAISPLTGLQLMARNAANGGKIYAQGLNCSPVALPATTPCGANIPGDNSLVDWVSGQYVVEHNGPTPIYWMGGVPQSAGPGVLYTRTPKDPLYLLAQKIGSDTRQCYDCLAVQAAVSDYFFGGVQVGYSGGTGYSDATYFTSTGGGQGCLVQGIMTASNGIPNGIEFLWGSSATGSYTGVGSGCTSAPTLSLVGATGTGVQLTANPSFICGTYTISGAGSGNVSSATCSNHYFAPFSAYASQTPVSGAPMSWFINSLVDPVP